MIEIESHHKKRCHTQQRTDLIVPKLPIQRTIYRIDRINQNERNKIVDKSAKDSDIHGQGIHDYSTHHKRSKIILLRNLVFFAQVDKNKNWEEVQQLRYDTHHITHLLDVSSNEPCQLTVQTK